MIALGDGDLATTYEDLEHKVSGHVWASAMGNYRFKGAVLGVESPDLVHDCPILLNRLFDEPGDIFSGVVPFRRWLRWRQAHIRRR